MSESDDVDRLGKRELDRRQQNAVDHPSHYGGEGNPYEAIRVIEAWGLNFNLGNAVKYISRAGKKPGTDKVVDLRKTVWYLNREADQAEPGTPREVNLREAVSHLNREIELLEQGKVT